MFYCYRMNGVIQSRKAVRYTYCTLELETFRNVADKYIDRKKGQDHESMWHRSILDTVGQAEKRGLVLYGAGFWGKIACRLFKKLGVQPLCYCDDAADKQEELCQGLTVYSFEKAVRVFPGAVYIVCVDSMRQVGKEKREHLDQF